LPTGVWQPEVGALYINTFSERVRGYSGSALQPGPAQPSQASQPASQASQAKRPSKYSSSSSIGVGGNQDDESCCRCRGVKHARKRHASRPLHFPSSLRPLHFRVSPVHGPHFFPNNPTALHYKVVVRALLTIESSCRGRHSDERHWRRHWASGVGVGWEGLP
jgi:hypothetical protein